MYLGGFVCIVVLITIIIAMWIVNKSNNSDELQEVAAAPAPPTERKLQIIHSGEQESAFQVSQSTLFGLLSAC